MSTHTRLRPFAIGAERTEILEPPEAFHAEFAERRSILCRNIFEASFLATLRRICNAAHYAPEVVGGLGHRMAETPSRAGRAITLALRRADTVRWVERAAGRGPFVGVDGRVIEARADSEDQLVWHNDMNDTRRRLGITINLSEQEYEGGMFEMRETATGRMVTRHHHKEMGAALLFAVSSRYEHRVLPVVSGGPRRIYTGWFLMEEGR